MNTVEIDNILYSDKYCGRMFKGTQAINALPPFEPGCYVVNLAPSNHPGLHCVAVFSLTGQDEVEYWCNGGNLISFKILTSCKDHNRCLLSVYDILFDTQVPET